MKPSAGTRRCFATACRRAADADPQLPRGMCTAARTPRRASAGHRQHGHRTAGCHGKTMHQPWETRFTVATAGRGAQTARAAVAVRGKGRAPSCNSTSVFTLPISAVEAAVTSLVFRHSAALPSPFLWQEQPSPGPLSSGWQCSVPPALLRSLWLALP